MANRNIIVIGASAGGIVPLTDLITFLPKDLNASIFIVQHIPAHSPSFLPDILNRLGGVHAHHPEDGDMIEPGKIYIAPPDRHLLIEKDRVVVRKGPKENRFRPSIDALFRSAAYEYGNRVIGVILSGLLDDGTSGLWSVKRLGGIAIVQEPEEAEYPDMPLSAKENVEVDFALPISKISKILSFLTQETVADKHEISKEELDRIKLEVEIATKDDAFERGVMNKGELTPFTCPSCHGVLVRIEEGEIIRFRCHTGHAYTASALLADVTTSAEEILWQAMRGLEEITMLLEKIGSHYKERGNATTAELFFSKAREHKERARVVHDSVFQQDIISEAIRFKKKTK